MKTDAELTALPWHVIDALTPHKIVSSNDEPLTPAELADCELIVRGLFGGLDKNH